jgi:hypothetical protein
MKIKRQESYSLFFLNIATYLFMEDFRFDLFFNEIFFNKFNLVLSSGNSSTLRFSGIYFGVFHTVKENVCIGIQYTWKQYTSSCEKLTKTCLL